MDANEYGNSATEVLELLKYIPLEIVNKIPHKFLEFLNEISNKDYKPHFNYNIPFEEFNLDKKTKELLGFIYITWWANNEETEEYKNIIKQENKRKKELYNINNIFKYKKNSN